MMFNGHFSKYEPGIFDPLRDMLLSSGDRFMHLADLSSYMSADRAMVTLYGDQPEWSRKVVLNVAGSGKFSSDRAIGQYASEIWDATPCPVD